MRWTHSLSRWLAASVAGLLSVSLVLALVGVNPRGEPSTPATALQKEKPAEVVPLFYRTEPAANDPVLVLQADDRGVHGWVSGKSAVGGAKVAIKAGGKDFEATVRDDNTFTWEHSTRKQLPVVASITPPGGKPLTARTTLLPAAPSGGPTIFFVTDRSAYRPGHTLKFAAFLRTLLPGGEFEPIRNRDVTVDLTSATKQTRATRLKLRSDNFGRVTGEYVFSEADALDHYQLTASGFTGDARVLLAEYRKSKVGLKLKGEVKDGKLIVTFDARDYLDRPVKGTAATYTATVIRTAEPEKLSLNPAEFARPEGGPPSADEFDVLPDDERLLTLANGVSAMTFLGLGSRQVGTREGTVFVTAEGGAKLELDLKPEWLKGNHVVSTYGVFTDETGRECRASATFKLDPNPTRGVRVSTSKELFATGEKIAVALTPFGLDDKDKANTTLILMRLTPQPGSPWTMPEAGDPDAGFTDYDGVPGYPNDSRLPALSADKQKHQTGWRSVSTFDPVKRAIHSLIPVVNNAAEVTLKQPGAYKLLAHTRLIDGTTSQSEMGIVVKGPATLPGLALRLDKREVESGSRLTGIVHTRFSGAKLLLTLRDSTGIKLTRTLTTASNGVVQIDEPLPANLRYGCAVCVQYPESATTVHVDQRELFVIPSDRTIHVTTSVPPEFGPGAEVPLTVQIDRQEETDLIVSVYDESLLGVSGDLSKDVRNFFLGDARGQGRAARELAATRVGNVPVAELVKKAEALLQDKERLMRDPVLETRLQKLTEGWKEGKLALTDVITLVRLTGLEVYVGIPGYYHGAPVWKVLKNATLADLLRWERSDARDDGLKLSISATVIGNVALVGVVATGSTPAYPSQPDPWIYHRSNPYGYGFGGYGQLGNLGNQFGFGGQFAGFGGQFSGFGVYGQYGPGFPGGIGGLRGNVGFGAGGLQMGGGMLGQFGLQGSFSHPGGQMGMSFGSNRDFGPQGPGGLPTGGPLPGLGLGEEVVRRDFADSAFWSATVRTDRTGKATTTFKVPDSLTHWRVQVTAISSRMHVGTGTAKFKTIRSIMIWPMLPRTFTEGDVVRVFGTVHNLTDKEQSIRVRLTAGNGQVMDEPERTVQVPSMGNVPVYWTYKAGTKGFTDLLMSAKCDLGSDASLKKLQVTAASIVERATASGLVGKGDLKINLPKDFDPARASVTVTIAPTLAADLADTLPYLVEYPYGCVEQTMSRFLPAIRVSQILRQSGISTIKDLEAKLPKVVEAGQKRLVELQQPDGGWAWQGTGLTHEMMTPYALFGLIQAENAGYACPNPTAIDRGLARLNAYLQQMGGECDQMLKNRKPPAQPTVVNDYLYCAWVADMNRERLKEAGAFDLVVFQRIEKSLDRSLISDYGLALALELAVKHGEKALAGKLVAELRERAKKSGDHVYWTTAGFSRWGDNVTEVTAAVMKALVAHDPTDPLIPGVLAFFHGTKRGDRWDSTKDTACVLYALCDYLAALRAGPAAAGLVKVNVNGIDDGNVRLDSPTSHVIKLTGKNLQPGENVFTVTGPDSTGGALARVVVSFTRGRGAEIPARDHGVKVTRTVSLRAADGKWTELRSGESVPAGSYLKVRVIATPVPGTKLQYTLLESPKPAGGETIAADDSRFPPAQDAQGHVLREDREATSCFHYENAAGMVAAEYVVLTEFVGEFRIAPARVELMYKPTVGGHSDSFVLKVAEKK